MSNDKLFSFPVKQGTLFLLLLLSADLIFCIFHVFHKISPFFSDKLFSLGTDRGYSEIFQYVKTYWIAILFGVLWWRTRQGIYLVWMLLFVYLLCDDALQTHELGGEAIAQRWAYAGAFGLRAADFGELMISGAAGLTFFALMLMLYAKSTRDAKNASLMLTLLFGLIVFFGVFVDMLHMMAGGGRLEAESGVVQAGGSVLGLYVKGFLGLVEDGGEMLAMSLVCCYTFNLVAHHGQRPLTFWQRSTTGLVPAQPDNPWKAAPLGSNPEKTI